MKNARGHGSERGNRGRPALTHAERYARRKPYHKKWRLKNRAKVAVQTKQDYIKWRMKYPERYLWSSAKNSARMRGCEFSIEVSDLLPLPEFCAVLGIRLEYKGATDGRIIAARATVDRIDNSKGYIPGNVCIISWRANKLKNNASGLELRALARYVSERGV